MFKEIFLFEIRYRMIRPVTYIYFAILFLMMFLAAYGDNVSIGNVSGLVNKNSPFNINSSVSLLMIFGTLICSAIMGVPVFRDFDHNFHEIMFTTPVKKWQYLAGRFLGSYLVALFVFSGMIWGNMLGCVFPGVNPDHIGKFIPMAYVQPFLLYIIPNVFILGVLFFAMGSLFRNQLAIYVQGVVLFILYLIILSNQREVSSNRLFCLLDPYGFTATVNITRYWTVAEKNSMIVPLTGWLLYNRIIWIGAAITSAWLFYRSFKFSSATSFLKGKKLSDLKEEVKNIPLTIPEIKINRNFQTQLKQWRFLLFFHFRGVIKSIPFIVITLCGVFMLLANSKNLGSMYGTSTLPVTYMILDMLTGNFMLFLIIIITFFSGELIWKEITTRIAPITDAVALPDSVYITAKLGAMILVELFLLVVLILTGVFMQMLNGFYEFEILIYIKSLLLNTFPFLVLITLLTFFIHSLVNNQFLGHTIVIVFWVLNGFLASFDIDHNLLYYGNSPTKSYSAMNGFGHFVKPVLWFDFYWLMMGIILFTISILMIKRGSELAFISRFRKMKLSWKAGHGKLVIPVALLFFIISGSFIYYNTNVLNVYRAPDTARKLTADFEKKYRKYRFTAQPRITAVNAHVDLFPETRKCNIKASYIIKNKNNFPLDTIILAIPNDHNFKSLHIGNGFKVLISDVEQGFYIYKLNSPIAAGDSIKMDFELQYGEKGFTNEGGSTLVVYNGTFINNGLLPALGYNDGNEMSDDDDRKKEGLPQKLYRMNPIQDTLQRKNTYLSSDADWIRYEAIVSTSADQIAISPGYLQKEWKEGNRRYFNYKMDSPIWNFYSFLSARYEVLRDKYNDVNIEIYYHKGHEYDLKSMVKAIKKTLAYCNAVFSPYQHKQVRIIEFPRYAMFAQSFPNTIPYSEGLGFIMKLDKESDIDMAFYVTAHEVGHQWWGHQVCGANVQGSTMMVESMAQYTALMVMEHEFGTAHMEKFLKYEMDRYLRGRAREDKREEPLVLNENQEYIHYQKGSLVFYALKDYIGEAALNRACSAFLKDYAFKDAPYPVSYDFLRYIRKETPDSLQGAVTDLFENITLFNNKTTTAEVKQSGNKYIVNLTLDCAKIYSDSIGREKNAVLNDWVDVGVYAKDKSGEDSLIYLEKKYFNKATQNFTLSVPIKPSKAGIDPLHKLIDRDANDNTKEF
ncbi:MAG: M1 family aminopeptidase [Bacteroidota bacterium]